jgi:hypothetical protein
MRLDELQLQAERREDVRQAGDRARVRGKPVQVPGEAVQRVLRTELLATTGEAGEVAELRAELARKTAELDSIRRARNPTYDTEPPIPGSDAFEFTTRHGLIAKRESRHLRFTAAQLSAAIQAGTEPHPGRAVLCADGWWTPTNQTDSSTR